MERFRLLFGRRRRPRSSDTLTLQIAAWFLGLVLLFTIFRTCVTSLVALPSLRKLQERYRVTTEKLPSLWSQLKEQRFKLNWLACYAGILFAANLAIWVFLSVAYPIAKSKDGVFLSPSSAQFLACVLFLALAIGEVVLSILWEKRLRDHQEVIDQLKKVT